VKEQNTKKFTFDYTWVIAALCFLMVAISLGFCSSGRNLYLTAITDALNIPRGAFSLTNTIRFATSTVVNLFFGKLVYKFGTKKLICGGFIALICFSLINTYATNLYVFYLGSICLGIGVSWTSTTMASAVVNKWVTKNKGTITGAILSANGIGGAIAVQIISPIIFQEGNPFGYRDSYRLVTVILLVTLALLMIFFRENPKGDTSKTVVGAKKRKARGEGWSGMDYETAIKKPYFYLALLCMFLTGMTLQGMGGISIPHMYDIGFDKAFVATLSSISSIMLTVTKFSTGVMYDRFGMRTSMNICFTCGVFSLVGLIFLTNTPIGHAIALSRSFITAVATPLETVMLPLFAMELFGNKDFNKFVGLFVSASYAGFAIGSPLGNLCYDILGDYQLSFVIFSAMMVCVIITMQYVSLAARRDRRMIEAAMASAPGEPSLTE